MFSTDNILKIIKELPNLSQDNSIKIGTQKELVLDIDNNIIYHDYFDNRHNALLICNQQDGFFVFIDNLKKLNKKYHLDLINRLDEWSKMKTEKEEQYYEYKKV